MHGANVQLIYKPDLCDGGDVMTVIIRDSKQDYRKKFFCQFRGPLSEMIPEIGIR